jgi:hypothetical protein
MLGWISLIKKRYGTCLAHEAAIDVAFDRTVAGQPQPQLGTALRTPHLEAHPKGTRVSCRLLQHLVLPLLCANFACKNARWSGDAEALGSRSTDSATSIVCSNAVTRTESYSYVTYVGVR